MGVKVIKQRVDTGEKVYFPGDVISGLSKTDEQELVDLGVCLFVSEDEGQQDSKNESDLPEGLVKLKGGFYLLPDGKKVRGLPAAIKALDELNNQSSNTDDDDDLDNSDNDPDDGSDLSDDSNSDGQDGPDTKLPGADG